MNETINSQFCNMSIILFSLLIIQFCFINNIYLVNGVSTNRRHMNIMINLDKLLDHINESTQIIKKYAEQSDNRFERYNTNINKVKK